MHYIDTNGVPPHETKIPLDTPTEADEVMVQLVQPGSRKQFLQLYEVQVIG